jgi:hypothetical protein
MGYRSDVVALIYPDAETDTQAQEKYDQLKVLMASTFKDTIDGFTGFKGFKGYMTWMDDERVLKFQLDDVKWYPSYVDVQLFDRMMTAFDPDSDDAAIPGYCTEFVRIGEESDDTEEKRTGGNN